MAFMTSDKLAAFHRGPLFLLPASAWP